MRRIPTWLLLVAGLPGLAGCPSSPTDFLATQSTVSGNPELLATGQAPAASASELRYTPTEAVKRAAIEGWRKEGSG